MRNHRTYDSRLPGDDTQVATAQGSTTPQKTHDNKNNKAQRAQGKCQGRTVTTDGGVQIKNRTCSSTQSRLSRRGGWQTYIIARLTTLKRKSHTPPTRPTAHQARGGEHAIPKRQNTSKGRGPPISPSFFPYNKKMDHHCEAFRPSMHTTPTTPTRPTSTKPTEKHATTPKYKPPLCRPTPGSPSLLFFLHRQYEAFQRRQQQYLQ